MNEKKSEENEFQHVREMEVVWQVFEDFPFYVTVVDESHRVVYANRIIRNEFGNRLQDAFFGCGGLAGEVSSHNQPCPVCESVKAGYLPVKFEMLGKSGNGRLMGVACPLNVMSQDGKRLFLCIMWDAAKVQSDEELYGRLRWNEEMYRAIFQNTPNVVGVFSASGVIVDANPVMAECFGSDMVGRNIRDVLPPDLSEKWMSYILCSVNECRRTTFEFSCNSRHYLMSMVPVSIAGERYCLLIGRDVTELKRRETLLRAMINIERLIDSEKDRRELLERICNELSSLPDSLLVRIDLVGNGELSIFSGKFSDAVSDVRCSMMDRAVKAETPFVRRIVECDDDCILRDIVADSGEVWITSLPLSSGRVHGALTVYHSRSLSQDELAILETISADISFALRAFELEELWVLAHKKIEDIIYRSAILTDEIKNALMVISGIAELRISGKESLKILEQVERIKRILEEIDRGWIESEKLRKFLKKFV